MKKFKIIGATVIVLAIIVAVLFNNRAKLQANTNKNIIDSYPVKVVTAGRQEVLRNIELVGTIKGDNEVAVVSEASGRVTGVYAEVNDHKSKGSVLIQLDNELKLSALKTAEVNYEKLKKDYERYQSLYNEGSITITRLEAAKLELQKAESQWILARREVNDARITAPISGEVAARLVDVGDYVNKGDVVASVVDISKLKVKLNVGEKDAFRLKIDDPVEISTEIYPGIKFTGKIESISSQGDLAHTYPVEISLQNSKEHPLKSGMFGRVRFTSANNSSLVIPREALIGSVKDAKVFVIENSVAEERDVVIGNTYDNMIEVLKGLNEGEQVVINGQNNLQNDSRVSVVR
jgi:RND family efflux transporter MFP subunit